MTELRALPMQTADASESRPFAVGNAIVSALTRPGVMELRWTGRSDDLHADRLLRSYFGACVSRAFSSKTEIEVHFEELAFANSASIGALIHLISLSQQHDVKLTLRYSSKFRWQQLCIRAMHWAARHPRTSFVDV